MRRIAIVLAITSIMVTVALFDGLALNGSPICGVPTFVVGALGGAANLAVALHDSEVDS